MSETGGPPSLRQLLAQQQPYGAYRNYRVLSRRKQSDVLQAEIEPVVASADALIARDPLDAAGAVAVGRTLTWDSTFFRVPMARLDHLLRPSSLPDTSSLARTAAHFVERCRDARVQHVSARVDVADLDLVTVLQELGFRLMDTLAIYINRPSDPAPPQTRALGRIRAYQPADFPQVMEITRDAYRGFRGRFQNDPHLPRDRADAFYLEWAQACCEGRMADRINVAERDDGRLLGWSSIRKAEPVSSVGGVPIFTGSLGAVRRDRPGAYGALIGAFARENHAAGAVSEVPTQTHNFPMIRTLEALGGRCARAEYAFHLWLG